MVTLKLAGDDNTYLVKEDFGDGRAIIDYGGALVMVQQFGLDAWELAGPALPGSELDALNAMLSAQGEGTDVTVTDAEGKTTDFHDVREEVDPTLAETGETATAECAVDTEEPEPASPATSKAKKRCHCGIYVTVPHEHS